MSAFDDIASGSVIAYPYLWARESARGETEGRKVRPVAVAVRLPRASGDALLLLPITTRPPRPGQIAIEIPDMEKRRAGLDVDIRSWISIDEFNVDVIARSFYLTPQSPLGRFSRAFFALILRRFLEIRSMAAVVKRHD